MFDFIAQADVWLLIVILCIGAGMLYFGAEGLVRGSISISIKNGISTLVVGLTVVAFGTSSPELLVSLFAGMRGEADIALGNVVGSNICNIALILGAAALFRPIEVNLKLIKKDMLIMLGVSLLLVLLVMDGELNWIDGTILSVGIATYLIYTLVSARKENDKALLDEFDELIPQEETNIGKDIFFIIGGLGVLILGSKLFVDSAVGIADYLGAPPALIALSVVAFGTSLPELATSILASVKKEGDISIGNAIGSNIFNILFVLGIASIAHEIKTDNIDSIDMAIMVAVSVILFPLAWFGLKITRPKGVFLLLIYFSYIGYLYMKV